MKVIYKPKGKAKEYADLAVNLYTGCPHRCQYPCFAPKILHKSPVDFHSKVAPREGIIGKIEADCAELEKRRAAGETIPPILLCFTCDPYPSPASSYDTAVTRAAIMTIKAFGLNFTVLTKAGLSATRDFDLYGQGDSFGVTLVFINGTFQKWEPYATRPLSRTQALLMANAKGIKTWISLEPVIDTEQALDVIRCTYMYTDHYKIGKLNYHPHAKTIDWADFTKRAVGLLRGLGKDFYIKDSLRPYLPAGWEDEWHH